MKKLLGAMILATLPVACGTTNPNAPEMPATADATGDASFAASGRGGRTALPSPPSCNPVTHVVVTLEDQQPGSAYFSVLASGAGDTTGELCGSPTWSVTPGRQVRLTPSLTGNSAVLEAPRGTYVVTASYLAVTRTSMSGSATVTFRR
jgi:hypothetical protein